MFKGFKKLLEKNGLCLFVLYFSNVLKYFFLKLLFTAVGPIYMPLYFGGFGCVNCEGCA